MAGDNPSCAAQKDTRSVNGQAPQRDEGIGRGSRMGAEKIVQNWLLLLEVSGMWQRRRHGKSTG